MRMPFGNFRGRGMDSVTSRMKVPGERRWGDDPTPWKLRIVWGRPVQLVRSTVMPEWWVGLLCVHLNSPEEHTAVRIAVPLHK